MPAEPKKKIPWQDRERIGGSKAFFMTMLEAFISPFEYFDKLETKGSSREALNLFFFNSLYLIGPLVPHVFSAPSFLAVLFILAVTPSLLLVSAFVMARTIVFMDEKADFVKCFYILTFATPAFVLAYVPKAGFVLAGIWYVLLAGIGLVRVFKISLPVVIAGLLTVPLLVAVPYVTIRYTQAWEINHPAPDNELKAQKVLAALSISAENYALTHEGRYPDTVIELIEPPKPFLAHNYCGETIQNYRIGCDFRNFGYFLEAKPQGWEGRGKKTFFVTTGGKLRALK